MVQGRPEIPTALKRAVLVEAGHRCALPTCRQTPVELAHITPWAKVRDHTFDNLIALCPTCHTRFDRGDIDRKAMLQYKANLEVLNHRYTDTERQLLKAFIRRQQMVDARQRESQLPALHADQHPQSGTIRIYSEMAWTVSNLLDDGMIEFQDTPHTWQSLQEGILNSKIVRLTGKGQELVAHWMDAEPI
ncbi:HNH endonuclease [Streptomyces sp. NPDC054863]